MLERKFTGNFHFPNPLLPWNCHFLRWLSHFFFWRFHGGIPRLLLPRSISAGTFLSNKPCIFLVLCQSNITDSKRVSRTSKERKPTANQPMSDYFRSSAFPIFEGFCPNFSIFICQTFFFLVLLLSLLGFGSF